MFHRRDDHRVRPPTLGRQPFKYAQACASAGFCWVPEQGSRSYANDIISPLR